MNLIYWLYFSQIFLYLPLNMTLGNKTIFGRACGAGSKIVFSDLHFKAPNTQNMPFHFQVAKNHSEAVHRDSRGIRTAIEGILTPPPPPPPFLY